MTSTPRIALVYDWLTARYGGAEQVLLALHQAFPDAPLFTSVYDQTTANWAQVFQVRSSFLQSFPWLRRHHRWLTPLLPLAFETLPLAEFEVIISITSAEAKGVLTKPHQLHLSYMLTPTRYLYSHQKEYLAAVPAIPGLASGVKQVLKYLRWWDQVAAHRPDYVIPISQLVADRITAHYHRSPEKPIYPPYFNLEPADKNTILSEFGLEEQTYLLVVSRLVEYKRIDVVIQACQQLARRLVIVGSGPQARELQRLAARVPEVPIHFLGDQPDPMVRGLMAAAQAVVMPGQEDFGITALEAASCGTPVVVHYQSGVAEILKPPVAALHLTDSNVPQLVAALRRLDTIRWDRKKIVDQVRLYDSQHFVSQFSQRYQTYWQQFQKGTYEHQ